MKRETFRVSVWLEKVEVFLAQAALELLLLFGRVSVQGDWRKPWKGR